MEAIILTEKHQNIKKEAISKIKTYKGFSETHKKFKVGEIIQFFGGYNDDILYETEIIGFDEEKIYVLWDCYWFSIADDEKRKIKIVK